LKERNWYKKENHPITQVSWDDAIAFCNWVTRISQQLGYADYGIRLPSEAEWEKAAVWQQERPTDDEAPKKRIYPWGNTSPTLQFCNFNWEMKGTTSVGQFSPHGDSSYGCADMAGNVWEWTSSQYRNYPYDVTDGREDPENHGRRVLRGGSFDFDHRYIHSTVRLSSVPTRRLNNYGFRVAVSLRLQKNNRSLKKLDP